MFENLTIENIEKLGMVCDLDNDCILLIGNASELDLENYEKLLSCVIDGIIYVKFDELDLEAEEIISLVKYLTYKRIKNKNIKALLELDLDDLKNKIKEFDYV